MRSFSFFLFSSAAKMFSSFPRTPRCAWGGKRKSFGNCGGNGYKIQHRRKIGFYLYMGEVVHATALGGCVQLCSTASENYISAPGENDPKC